tara:strand:- start:82 stop:1002 length:921 start_codon:yes stop_codon:yes gene_type:complete
MKVFVLAPQENWICDRIAQEWYQHNKEVSTNSILECDILWLLAGWCWNHIHPNILIEKKVIVTVHHIVPEKMSEEKTRDFLVRDQFVDCYHVPNSKTKKMMEGLTQKPVEVVGYWYDESKWFPLNKQKCREELGLPASDFIVGSFQRDTEGGDLKTPKLEKGPDLFCEYLETIDKENMHVLLGGFRRQYVMNRLDNKNIKYTYFELSPVSQLQKMYAACDLYIVASRHEGGPQSALEASAMRVPIVSTDVGIVPTILSENCIINIPNEQYFPIESDIDYGFKQVKKYEIRSHKKNYINLFESVLGK